MCAAAVVLAAGCYDPHPATGIACTTTGGCPDGQICWMGTCESNIPGDATPADDRGGPDTGVDAPASSPMLVQQATGSRDHAATLSVSLLAAPTAGHVLVMIGANEHHNLSSVTGGGATWTIATQSAQNTNVEVWLGLTDGSSSTVTINCTTDCEAQPIWMNVSEWSGLATANALEAATAKDGIQSPATAGTVTTTGTQDLLLFAVTNLMPDTAGQPAPGTWHGLSLIQATAIDQHAWYGVVAAGTYAPQVTETGNAWDAAIVALRAAP
jgi:hypothetical protein